MSSTNIYKSCQTHDQNLIKIAFFTVTQALSKQQIINLREIGEKICKQSVQNSLPLQHFPEFFCETIYKWDMGFLQIYSSFSFQSELFQAHSSMKPSLLCNKGNKLILAIYIPSYYMSWYLHEHWTTTANSIIIVINSNISPRREPSRTREREEEEILQDQAEEAEEKKEETSIFEYGRRQQIIWLRRWRGHTRNR